MRLKKTTGVLLALLFVPLGHDAVFAQDEDEQVNSPNAIREQKVEHAAEVRKVLNTLGTPETVYDYITFGISGPVVVLQGFTINGALRDNAKTQIQKLDWVSHVVQEVELQPVGPELKRIRKQILGILKKQVPQAFPTGHADIRIGVDGEGQVTLIGVIGPKDEKRYLAAVEQIKHVTFIAGVTDKVVKDT
jgi:hypothetical protein